MNSACRKTMSAAAIVLFGTAGAGRAGETYTLDGDRQMDGDAPVVLAFKNTAEKVTRTGEDSPWTFDFSSLPNVSVVNLGSRKLYCARATDTDKQKIVLDLVGADLIGTNGLSIKMWRDADLRNGPSDDLAIVNVGAVDIGGIDARNSGQDNVRATVQIGTAQVPAGFVRTEYLYANHYHAGPDDISDGGNVTVYGSNDVAIASRAGVPGDIVTRAEGRYRSGGDVIVSHRGHFRVGSIDTSSVATTGGSGAWAGAIRLDGGDASGDMIAEGDLRASHNLRQHRDQVRVVVENYRHVEIRGNIHGYYVNTANRAEQTTCVVVTNNIAGDIRIFGAVDLENRHDDKRAEYSGWIQLKAAGRIELTALDLRKVHHAFLSGEKRGAEITGAIDHFDVNTLSGSGSATDPYVTNETRLRAPFGQRVYYSYRPGVLNDGLQGRVWRLRDLDGEAPGGLLMVRPPAGTVVLFQ